MNTKPKSCSGCVLEHVGHGFVPDDSKDSQVAILGFCPSKDDASGRHLTGYAGPKQPIYETTTPQPFIGSAGWLLTQTYLPAAGLTRQDVSLHHLIKCHVNSPPHEDTLLLAVNHCVGKHLNISDEVKLLVTLGEVPWQIIQGTNRPIRDWRGFLGEDMVIEDNGKGSS